MKKEKRFKNSTKKELFEYIFETERALDLYHESYNTTLIGLQKFQNILDSNMSDSEKLTTVNDNLDKIYLDITLVHNGMISVREEKLLIYRNIIGNQLLCL